ncbi:MAG: hypothetical protein AAF747_01305 [Planctomycetota bacterium]
MRSITKISAVVLASASTIAAADVLSVSFVGQLTGYNGPAVQDPFNPGTLLGGAIAANPDLGRFDGQFVVTDFDPTFTGTYTFGPGGNSDPGVQFFLHSPILERLEAQTTRLAAGNAAGVSENTKILLPRRDDVTSTDEVGVSTTGFFGTGLLQVVNGVPVAFSYNQGENTLNSFDFRFNPLSLEDITIGGDNQTFTLDNTFDLDTPGGADNAPYGFNTPLSAFPGSTILDTTVGALNAELAAGTILTTRASSGGVPIADPLAGVSGSWFQYGAGGIEASISVVPTPASAAVLAFAGVAASRRRR